MPRPETLTPDRRAASQRGLYVLIVALSLACAAAFLDARSSSSGASSSSGTAAPNTEMTELERLVQAPSGGLYFQHTSSAAFVLVDRQAEGLTVRVSAYPLNPESHARLGALWEEHGRAIEPYREPIGQVVFYDLPLGADSAQAGRVVDRIFSEVFELELGYELYIERQ